MRVKRNFSADDDDQTRDTRYLRQQQKCVFEGELRQSVLYRTTFTIMLMDLTVRDFKNIFMRKYIYEKIFS